VSSPVQREHRKGDETNKCARHGNRALGFNGRGPRLFLQLMSKTLSRHEPATGRFARPDRSGFSAPTSGQGEKSPAFAAHRSREDSCPSTSAGQSHPSPIRRSGGFGESTMSGFMARQSCALAISRVTRTQTGHSFEIDLCRALANSPDGRDHGSRGWRL